MLQLRSKLSPELQAAFDVATTSSDEAAAAGSTPSASAAAMESETLQTIKDASFIIEEVLEHRWSCDERAIVAEKYVDDASIDSVTKDANSAVLITDAIGRMLDNLSSTAAEQHQALKTAKHQIIALEQRVAFQKWESPAKFTQAGSSIPVHASAGGSARSTGTKHHAKENVTPIPIALTTAATPSSAHPPLPPSTDKDGRSKSHHAVRRNLLGSSDAAAAASKTSARM